MRSRRQRHNPVCEALHALYGLRRRVALQVHVHVTDAQFFIALDVIRDLLRRAGQRAALAIGQGLGLQVVQPTGAVGETYGRRVASNLLGIALDPGGIFGVLRRGADGEARVGADGIPGISEASGPTQRRRALATDPDGWVRLLHRFGRERDVREAAVLALEGRIVAGPQLLEGADVLVADGTALVVGRRAQRLELLAHPAYPAADDEASVRQHVDRRQDLRGQYRWTVRQYHD